MLTYGQALMLTIVYLMALQLVALYHYVAHRRGHDRPLIRRIAYGEAAVPPYLLWLGLGALYAVLFLLLWSVPHFGLFYFLALVFLTSALLSVLVCDRCEDLPKLLLHYQFFLAAFLFYLVVNIRLYSFESGTGDFLFLARIYFIPVGFLIAGSLYFTLRTAPQPVRGNERE